MTESTESNFALCGGWCNLSHSRAHLERGPRRFCACKYASSSSSISRFPVKRSMLAYVTAVSSFFHLQNPACEGVKSQEKSARNTGE